MKRLETRQTNVITVPADFIWRRSGVEGRYLIFSSLNIYDLVL